MHQYAASSLAQSPGTCQGDRAIALSYQRHFPAHIPTGNGHSGYIQPTEYIDPDEDEVIARVRDGFVGDTRRPPEGAGKDDPTFHEPHWGHSTGLLRGTLGIDRISDLPEDFRVGLFERERSYPVVRRPNFIVDKKLRLRAARIAVKLKYPTPVPSVDAPDGEAHELDLLLVEGHPSPTARATSSSRATPVSWRCSPRSARPRGRRCGRS